MFIGELECLNKTKCFINTATNRQVIDGDLTQCLLGINDEESTQCHTSVLKQNSIVATNLHRLVGQKRILESTETAFLARCVQPCQMREVRVSRNTDNFTSNVAEILDAVGEGDNLRGTDESAAKGINKISLISTIFCCYYHTRVSREIERGEL